MGIKLREITQEMRESYLDYAMSVIVSRALPDVRDGLKPVHRRILHAMNELGLKHTAKYMKSARVVGEVMGKFHPHGDLSIYDAMARMVQDFSMRHPLIDGQGNWGCFTGDTKIALTDGRNLSFIDLIKEHKNGGKNLTYTFNHKTNTVEIAEIKNPRLTRKDAKLVEVILNNGKKIKCTPDHRFMLLDGSYKEAQFLYKGDSLMPLYSRLSTVRDDKNAVGYKMVWQPIKKIWDWVHRSADEWNIKNGVYRNEDGKVRHHLDFNKLNNNPDNIRRMQWADHWRLHCQLASFRHKNDPEYVDKLKEGRRRFWAIPENRVKNGRLLSERSKKWWQNPEYRKEKIEAVKKPWNDLEYKEKMKDLSSRNLKNLWGKPAFKELLSRIKSEELKSRWKDGEYKKRMAEFTRITSNRIWSNPKLREYMIRSMKERMSKPEIKKKYSEIAKKSWEDPYHRAKYTTDHFSRMAKALWSDPEVVKLHSIKARKQWTDPEFRKKIIEAVRERNKERLLESPDFMKKLTERARVSLERKWRDPTYKDQVIKSKILRHVKNLMEQGYKKVTPKIYEEHRKNDGTPQLSSALNYFLGFQEIIQQAKIYNHKIVSIKFLSKREDVYDLTTEKDHNFALAAGVFVHNSIDGDNQAAMRYTECKMTPIAEELLADIGKDTVDFTDNYDATRKEPMVLPAKFPNLLVNGSLGIAVGMATSIPPHNLGELVDAICYLIEKPDAEFKELLTFIQGPDFPTGGIIYNQQDIVNAYALGRGPLAMRGRAEIEETKRGFEIIISEIPYQVNKAELIIKMADLVKDKKIEGIRDIRDESDKDGLRVVVELKQDVFPKRVLNQLFKYTDLQKNFHFNMVALVDGIQPQTLGVKGLLEQFVKHRQIVVTRRSQHDMARARERAHILEGLKKALDHIDEIISLIKKSESKEAASDNLIKKFKFTEIQAKAILEMKLQALAGLERKKLENELKEKKELISYLEDLLAHPKKILAVVKKELVEVKEKYANPRRTKVVKSPLKEIGEEELVPEEDTLFVMTRSGYIKRLAPDQLRTQKRGGKGLVGIETREEDVVSQFFLGNTRDNILFFTNSGKVFQIKGYEVPEASRQSKGKAITNFLQLSANDLITAVVPISKKQNKKYLFMATAKGIVKRVTLEEFGQVRKSGMIALKLKGQDQLEWVLSTSGNDQIILITSGGNSIRFEESDVRHMGRSASGVAGVKLGEQEFLVGADVVTGGIDKGLQLLVIMENGYGKRTELKFYKVQHRGGRGIMTGKITPKTGKLVSGYVMSPENKELIVVSKRGQVIRTSINSISVLGRATQGVRIMKLDKGDNVASVAVV